MTSDNYGYVGPSETAYEVGSGTVTDALLDLDGSRLAVKTGTTVSWVVFDLHGSVAALCTAGTSSISDATRYDPWGQPISSGSTVNPWRYRGLLDVSPNGTPLLDMGARFYAPNLGAFTSEDSVQGRAIDPASLNRYLYAEADPATLIDPDGHAVTPIQGICPYGPEDCAAIGWQSTSSTRSPGTYAKPTTMTTNDEACSDASCRHSPTPLPPVPPTFTAWLELNVDQRAAVVNGYGVQFLQQLLDGKVEKRYWAVYFAIAQLWLATAIPDSAPISALNFFTIDALQTLANEALAAGDKDTSGWAYAESIHFTGWSDAGVSGQGLAGAFGAAGGIGFAFGGTRRVGVNSEFAKNAGTGPDYFSRGSAPGGYRLPPGSITGRSMPERAARAFGVDPNELQRYVEEIKRETGRPNDYNLATTPDGTIVDPRSGEELGDVRDLRGQ